MTMEEIREMFEKGKERRLEERVFGEKIPQHCGADYCDWSIFTAATAEIVKTITVEYAPWGAMTTAGSKLLSRYRVCWNCGRNLILPRYSRLCINA